MKPKIDGASLIYFKYLYRTYHLNLELHLLVKRLINDNYSTLIHYTNKNKKKPP